ncbi:AAA family ATPase [Pseudoalteromonas luteoviolacea]|uniref:AAA family ATPase n=1 Tax=Pseudoalteromonas luteoviolacea TaxID=43657 RepID=UPI001B393477|nr:AAA family ATPase [Pseudoalteromonas luteoviolacea]MBQ4813414.1 AAA family ATPase [Pseudoalteromonas luteoviolacea]
MQSQILPSRAALVDRVAMQFEYGQSLICLVGNSGLGKSYLAESFITDKYEDFSKAFIQLSAQSKDTDVIRQLMEHTFRSPIVDQKLSLSENFFVLHSEQPAEPCLWVLDGARHLSDELIAELQRLATSAPTTLYILVTAQSPGMVPGALDIHLEPLSFSESKQLMKMFFRELPPEDDPIFTTFVTEAHGNPSVLLGWTKQSQSLDLRQPSGAKSKQKHFFIAAFSIVLALCLIAALYNKQLMNLLEQRQSAAQQNSTALTEPTVLKAEQVLTDLVVTDLKREEPTPIAGDEKGESSQVSAVLGALLSAPSAEVEQRKRLDGSEKGNTPVAENVESEIVSGERLSTSSVIPDTVSGIPAPPPVESTPVKVQPPISESSLASSSNDNDWFTSRPDTEWSIQLLAVTDRKVVDDFLTRYSVDNLRVAEVIRSGKTWWFVTLAPYGQLEDAKRARENLSEDLLAAKPFFKRISQIKQQIQQSQ